MFLTTDEVRLIAPIVDDYFQSVGYTKLLEGIFLECPDPKEALVEFYVYIVMGTSEDIERALDAFFEIPLERMPLYFIPRPLSQLKKATSACPPLSEGPYPWQSFLALWRVKIQK